MYLPDPFRTVAFGREWPPRSPAATAAIVDHLFAFSLAGIRALTPGTRTRKRAPGRHPRAA